VGLLGSFEGTFAKAWKFIQGQKKQEEALNDQETVRLSNQNA